MVNLGPMFLSSYETISNHMEIYEQNLIQKEGEKRGKLDFQQELILLVALSTFSVAISTNSTPPSRVGK